MVHVSLNLVFSQRPSGRGPQRSGLWTGSYPKDRRRHEQPAPTLPPARRHARTPARPHRAALILGWRSGELLDFIPAYTAARGGLLSDCHLINESVAAAKVVDAGGRQLTAMAFEAEQYRQLQALGGTGRRAGPDHRPGRRGPGPPRRGRLRRPPGSQLDPAADPGQEPPPHYRERGWSWPPRLAAESFISYGVFADPAQAQARARLSGTVLEAGQHVCALTGQPFTVAAVRTAGLEADLCLADSEHPGLPAPGTSSVWIFT